MGDIAYQLVGSGARKLVFFHGLMGRGRNFGAIARSLGDEFTSLLVDMPNHGESAWTESFSYLDMADALAEVVRDEFASSDGKPESVALVGHSMGGKAAMVLALRHPELIERLAVVDIAPGASGSSPGGFEHLLTSMMTVDLTTVTRRSDADAQLLDRIPDTTIRQFLLQNLRPANGGSYAWQPNLAMLTGALNEILGWPEFVAPPYTGPVLWIAGEKSNYIREEDEALMRALFPRVRKVTIRDSGHWVHSEQPERFLATLRYFLDQPNPEHPRAG
ncbi:alpha/beta fold hydrolase [Gulosibacter sediminis]|uniref:alpha/beta fold hydrolase n=1 Tax=Gulosibacter sediminis TaxID=1729695 RepID=UPI0024AD6354|nr:alpha/beta fold hydrolase [Gulosibacter sediminis]